jgi:hypothetical protein
MMSCRGRFRCKFAGWNAHASKGIATFPGKTLLLLCLGLSLGLTTPAATAAGVPARDFPPPVDSYQDVQIPSIFAQLAHRIEREPLNLVASVIFFAAIIHTFLLAQFRKIADRYQRALLDRLTLEELPMTRLLGRMTLLMLAFGVQLVSAATGSAGSGDFAGLVDIGGGRKMYLECRGRGSPTVVLVAGLKASPEDWNIAEKPVPTVFAEVAKFTRVCA